MYSNLDFSGLVYLAIFGLICAVVLALGAAGGLVWFFMTHVSIV